MYEEHEDNVVRPRKVVYDLGVKMLPKLSRVSEACVRLNACVEIRG